MRSPQRPRFYALPVIRITATDTYTPEALRAKLIADYKHAKSGPLPVEMLA